MAKNHDFVKADIKSVAPGKCCANCMNLTQSDGMWDCPLVGVSFVGTAAINAAYMVCDNHNGGI